MNLPIIHPLDTYLLTMTEEENRSLRAELEVLRRKNNEAWQETNSYKDKYAELVNKFDEEIKKRVQVTQQTNSPETPPCTATVSPPNVDVINDLKQEAVSAVSGLCSLEERWSYLDYNLNSCLFRLNKSDQYSRINSLLFKGFPRIPEDKKHGRALKEFLLEELNKLFPNLEGGAVLPSQIEFGHTLKTRQSSKHVVIIKFSCRFTRNAIFYSKRFLPKDCGVSISEHLTFANLQLLNEAKAIVGGRNAWTSQTKIFVKLANGSKVLIASTRDLQNLQQQPVHSGHSSRRQGAVNKGNMHLHHNQNATEDLSLTSQSNVIGQIKNFIADNDKNHSNNNAD